MQFKTRRLALISALLLSASAEGAFAGEAWRIVDTAGTVRAGGAGFMPVALNRNQTLPSDAWVETAANGRVVLARGNETIVVSPNSRVMLPDREVDGNTQVLQTLGSALYKIGKQKKPHFQVDTPYLAAVVKGTEFTVAVDGGEASVMVTEGLVEVATPDRSDVEFVKPGFTATVTAGAHGDVVVDQTPADDHAKNNAGHGNDAANDKEKDNNGKSDKAAAADSSVVIPVAIGDVTIDVKEVSGGLAHGELKTAAIDTGKDKSSTESEAGGKDGGKPATDSADVGGTVESADAPKLNGGGHQTVDVVAAPDLGGDNAAPNLGGNNGNGNGAGNGNGGGAVPDIGGGPIVDIVPDLGGGSNGNNGSGNGGGNGNGGGGKGKVK